MRHAAMLAGMTTRGQVREAILAISLNDDLKDRADAAWCLVRFIGEVEVDRRLVALAHDSEDTYVTEAAVEALSFRGDLAAWRVHHKLAPDRDQIRDQDAMG